jgi:hypothetical protein
MEGMIMQPAMVTDDSVGKAHKELQKKKRLPDLSKIRFESFHEGIAAQIMYMGPFSEEGPTIQKIHEFIRQHGATLTGKHHEIYLKDPRRVAPEKLKSIIRRPMSNK